jgi:hypothetical protein|tara:strand:- start:914 stop:1612 length:699 start_codon:yes stop_codon:yes gene_type:complete
MRNILKYYSLIFSLTLMISCSADDLNIPGKVTLISPADNQTCETGTSTSDTQTEMTFSWSSSEYTENYDLKITNLNSNKIVWESKNKTTTSTVVLDKGQPYSWSVNSRNSNVSDIVSSDTWKFYLGGLGVVNYAPFPATLKTPANSSTVSRDANGKITFTWEGNDPDVGDTLQYTFYVDKIDGKQTPSSDHTDLSAEKLEVTLDAASTYYWRVKTSDGKNNSYSLVRTFKTK